MKTKVSRIIDFLSSRLQVTAAERTLILCLGGLLILLSGTQQLLSAGGGVLSGPEYQYDERIALFNARMQHVQQETAALEAQYYPDTADVSNSDAPALPEAEQKALPASPENASAMAARAEAPARTAPQDTLTSEGKININTATTEELETLPGIGPAIASRIIEHRNQHGSFERIENLKDVRGIAEGRFSAIKDLITVGGNEPE